MLTSHCQIAADLHTSTWYFVRVEVIFSLLFLIVVPPIFLETVTGKEPFPYEVGERNGLCWQFIDHWGGSNIKELFQSNYGTFRSSCSLYCYLWASALQNPICIFSWPVITMKIKLSLVISTINWFCSRKVVFWAENRVLKSNVDFGIDYTYR